MNLIFFEAVQGPTGPNWGKFAVGVLDAAEWQHPSQVGDSLGISESLIVGRGWSKDHLWVLDLQTGEGAMFRPGGLAKADLEKHRIWVCPLFEPFLEWLYERAREADGYAHWLWELPNVVESPDAEGALYGYRRPGPAVDSVPGL